MNTADHGEIHTKLGLGFAMSNATDDNLRAAAQMGATHAFINNANVGNDHFEFD